MDIVNYDLLQHVITGLIVAMIAFTILTLTREGKEGLWLYRKYKRGIWYKIFDGDLVGHFWLSQKEYLEKNLDSMSKYTLLKSEKHN